MHGSAPLILSWKPTPSRLHKHCHHLHWLPCTHVPGEVLKHCVKLHYSPKHGAITHGCIVVTLPMYVAAQRDVYAWGGRHSKLI